MLLDLGDRDFLIDFQMYLEAVFHLILMQDVTTIFPFVFTILI